MPASLVVPCASPFPRIPRVRTCLIRFKSPNLPTHTSDSQGGKPWIRADATTVRPKGVLVARATGTESSERENGSSTTSSPGDESKVDDTTGGTSPTSFLSILCPLLKIFAGGDPSQQRNEVLEVTTSLLSSIARLPWGSTSLSWKLKEKPSPERNIPLLQLYEFEACPFCRRVREALTELDLSVEVYPCPKGSLRHRQMVRNIGGKEQFPFLVDLNSDISMYESGDIVKYLFQQYGRGEKPTFGLLESTLFTGWMPTLLRAGRGMMLWQKAQKDSPAEKLVLFSFENNPYARIVREALCELELPYILYNVGKGSSNQKLLSSVYGSNEVPYLIDPNTGTQLSNHKKILSYLFETYSTGN